MGQNNVKNGNGTKVEEFRADACKRVKTTLWANEGDNGVMHSVSLQKGYKPQGSSKWNNQNMTFIGRLEIQAAIACLQGALDAYPETVKQNEGSANEYTSVSIQAGSVAGVDQIFTVSGLLFF